MVANLNDVRLQNLPMVIFSTDSGSNEDRARRAGARSALNSIGAQFTECEGVYNGESEHSFAVILDGSNFDFAFIKSIARAADQESVLYLTSKVSNLHRQAVLHFLEDDSQEYLGDFKYVEADTAMTLDAYTYVPNINCYFAAV